MADQIYLEEFLFRGRPPGSDQEPAYHIVLGVVGQDAFGKPTLATSGALTPEQAKEHGIDLPKALDAINAGVMEENTALKATNQAQARRIADLEAASIRPDAVEMTSQDGGASFSVPDPSLANHPVNAELLAMVDSLRSELADVRAELAAATAETRANPQEVLSAAAR